MDTYEFVEIWNAHIPADWPVQATIDREHPGDFENVGGWNIVFTPGMRIRGLPDVHAERMVGQGLVRRIEDGA